jgi:hypothetical protein
MLRPAGSPVNLGGNPDPVMPAAYESHESGEPVGPGPERPAAGLPSEPWPPPAPLTGPLTGPDQGNPPATSERLETIFQNGLHTVGSDFSNYFSLPSMGCLALGVGAAAVPANTRLDNDVRNWYQDHVRSATSDGVAAFWKNFGNGWITIPVCVGAELAGNYFDDYPLATTLGEFGDRSVRAYVVGTLPMLAMQELLGSGRPSNTADNSQWRPFASSHGVSGHAFISGVPFITAAKMSDDPVEKVFFYACSTMTAWSRINDDAHYLSQAWMGWCMAYLSWQAVDATQQLPGHLTLVPIATPEMNGIGLQYQR